MSLNDPQWGNRGNDNNDGGGGRRPNQGPPDLDQLWRDLNRRLSGIFDKKRGGGDRGGDGDGGDRPPVQFSPKFLGGGIGMLLVLVLIVWLASGFYIVDAGQRGLVLQFGQVNIPELGCGFLYGNVTKLGDASGDPGKSSLFFLTDYHHEIDLVGDMV